MHNTEEEINNSTIHTKWKWNDDYESLSTKIYRGVKRSIDKLIKKSKELDQELVVSVDGKPTRIKAKDIK